LATHFFTVDVEEYFQVNAFEPYVPRERWTEMESRVERSMDSLLALLDGAGMQGTFFVLGHVAQHHPELVRAIADAGHEVASHGWDHRRVTEQTPEEFRVSIPGREWALEILAEEGHAYDSSLFPIHRPGYGYASAPRHPHWVTAGQARIAEFPPTTLRRLGANLPAAGGAYFRIFPYRLVQQALRDCDRAGLPGTFYIHPWEVDPEQPRIPVSRTARFRHYTGLHRTLPRLRRLLSEFRFTSIAQHLRVEQPAMAV
jgi:peptidoglycan/xylan/chitin deacetylase (PgdA/CDA1 family)